MCKTSFRRFVVDLTTASGTATGYTVQLTGRLIAILYRKDGTTGFSNGSTFTITAEDTAQNLLTESNVNASADRYLARTVQDNTGATIAEVVVQPVLVDERVKIVVTNAGNGKLGQFIVIVATE